MASAQALVRDCEQIKQGLRQGEKVATKREAVKLLNTVLDSPHYLRFLDQTTAGLGPQDPLPVASWPGLAAVLAAHVTHELKASVGKKKGVDAALHRTFRRLVQLAEDDKRSGRRLLLARRATRLFEHVRDVLKAAKLASPMGGDYAAMLRGHLLPCPQYCACSSAEVFQELISLYMDRLEGEEARSSEEVYRLVAALQALLGAFPGDMSPSFAADVPAFLNELFLRLNEQREDSRITAAALACLNTFLLAEGRDVFSLCAPTHLILHPLVLRVLRGGRDPKLREVAVAYLCIQLQLGTLQCNAGWMRDLRGWVLGELGGAAPPRWGEDGREGRLLVGKAQHAVLELAAAVWYHSSSAQSQQQGNGAADGDAVEEGGEAGGAPVPAPKRRRTVALLPALLDSALGQPAAWAPVAAQLLLSYGLALPADVYGAWLHGLAAQVPRLLAPTGAGGSADDQLDPDATLWLLRFAHALAVAWPAQLAAGAAAGGGAAGAAPADAQLQPARLREQWRVLWDAVLDFARTPSTPPAAFAAAASLLAVVVRRGLAQLPPGFHRLWDLPVLGQPPTPAALELLAAAVQSGSDAAAEGTAWQEEVLGWLKSSGVAAAPSSLAADAFAAVVRLPSPPSISSGEGSGAGSSSSAAACTLSVLLHPEARRAEQPSWQWWQQDWDVDGPLAGLLRGETYMQAKALTVAAAAAAADAAAPGGGGRPRAGEGGGASAELHELASNSLADLLEDILRQSPSLAPLHAGRVGQLAQLLGACTAAVAVTTQAAAAAAAAGGAAGGAVEGGGGAAAGRAALPHCWSPDGALALKLQLALQRCGSMLAERCKQIEGISPLELHRLRQLTAALDGYQATLCSAELGSSLLSCMPEVQQLFLDASRVMPGLVMTQAVGGRAAAAAATAAGAIAAEVAAAAPEAFFDDDLDVGGKAPAAARGGGAGVDAAPPPPASSSELVSACRARCIALLRVMGPLDPGNGWLAAALWLQHGDAGQEGPLEEGQFCGLVGCLVACAAAALPADRRVGLRAATKALERLGPPAGLVAWSKFHDGRLLFAMDAAARLASALAPHAGEEGPLAALGTLAALVDAACEAVEAAEKRAGDKLTSWRLRVALGRAAAALLHADPGLIARELAEQLIGGLLADDRYPARLEGGALARALLAGAAPAAAFAGLRRRLCLVATDVNQRENVAEHMETSVFMLAETAVACGPVELECLLLLCRQAAQHIDHLGLVGASLDWMAAALRYPSRRDYVAWHQLPLIYQWCATGMGLVLWVAIQPLVATTSAAAADLAVLLASCGGAFAVVLLIGQRGQELQGLAEAMHTTPAALVRQHYWMLWGVVHPMSTGRQQEKELAARVLRGGLVAQLLQPAELEAAFGATVVDAIGQSLIMAHAAGPDGGDPGPPFYSADAVVQAALKTAGQATAEANAEVLFGKVLVPSQLPRLLLAVHHHLRRARHPRHMEEALVALRALLALLEGQAMGPPTVRYAVAILLRVLREPPLRAATAAMLAAVAKRALAAPPLLHVLGAMLPSVLSTLAEGIEAEQAAAGASGGGAGVDGATGSSAGAGSGGGGAAAATSPAGAALLALVHRLTLEAPPALRPYLRAADPLPAVPGLAQASALLAELQKDVTPVEQLAQFAARASSMTPALRRRALQALRRVLASQQAALFGGEGAGAGAAQGQQGGSGGGGGGAGDTLVCRPEVADVAWCLAALSGDLGDPDLATFAGELLALVGPLDPSATAFDPADPMHLGGPRDPSMTHVPPSGAGPSATLGTLGSLGTGATQARTPAPGAARGGGRGRGAAARGGSPSPGRGLGGGASTWAAALHLLADYLVDEEVRVIEWAQFTLKRLLATPEGQAALAALDDGTRPYVEVFAPAPGGPAPGVPVRREEEAADPRWRLDADRLWACGTSPYAAWVCELAHALLLHTASPTLATCYRMVALKPALAELLLPHAFADLAQRDADGGLSARLGAAISRNVLPEGHRHPKAMQLFFTCLNFLRCQFLDAMAGEGRAGGGGARGRAGAAVAPPPSRAEVEAWRRVYWIDLDYLAVAEAAAKCGAHFTALLYIEHWCEAAFGRLALAPPAGGGGGDAALASDADRVGGLLLDLYSQVNEPDSIYAVVRSHAVLSQLKRAEHEGSWDRALVMYDLVLQNIAAQAGGGGAPGEAAGGGCAAARGAGALGGGAPPLPSAAAFEGVGYQAAIAGLARSLSQLGVSYLLRAFSAAPGAAGAAAAEAAAGLGRWAPLAAAEPALPGGGAPAGGSAPAGGCALAAAVAALEAGSMQRCKQVVAAARRGLVAGLVTASLEGAAHVNPALVELQQLQEVSEAWELRWPSMPDLGAVGSPRRARLRHGGTAAAAAPGLLAADPALLAAVVRLWRAREADAGAGERYGLLAPLQALRTQLMGLLGAPHEQAGALLDAAVAARKTRHHAQATSALYKLHGLLQQQEATARGPVAAGRGRGGGGGGGGLPAWLAKMLAPGASWRVEEAKLLWAQGQQDTAVQLAGELLAAMESGRSGGGADPARRAVLQCLRAKWLSHTRAESPAYILGQMQAAAAAMDRCGAASDPDLAASACRVTFRLAHYADSLYRSIQAKRASPEHADAQAVLRVKREQLAQLLAQMEERKRRGQYKINKQGMLDHGSRLLDYHIKQLQRPVEMDSQEQELMAQNERQFLLAALRSYGRCLAAGDAYELRVVFRLVQLWLGLAADAEVNALLADALGSVPSHKLLPLVYQLASRMSMAKDRSGFQAALRMQMVRMAREHPYHTLYQVFALKNGNRGKDGRVQAAPSQAAVVSYSVDTDKVAAAEAVLAEVTAGGGRAAEIAAQMGELIEGYVELAALEFPKDATTVAFPAALRRAKRHFTLLPMPSVAVPVDLSGAYEGLATFESFGDRIQFVGGINRPKVVSAVDSAGRQHRQLVKAGNDDLRQDAVMQQFFWLLNRFLGEQPEAQRRRLSISTYRVLPFTPCAGLVEWVEDTLPMGDYLLGPNRDAGAHLRYHRPGQLTFMQAMAALLEAQARPDRRRLAAAFADICARFPPVMHRFFLEHYRQPGTWFERRLAYARSVAAASMAGYIIGLGDRHSANILLQLGSAEVVHIDLGIAFEQGRFLNTPELVPFRLTQDVVDGMGCTGVEGVMRRCCEETLRVLRASKESILTVIEVFIHDPLYKWGLTLAKAARRQQDGGGDGGAGAGGGGDNPGAAAVADGSAPLTNVDARRTLLRVQQKLEGVEGGEGEPRGVEGQVQQLLADATDPDKLARMYVGWAAFV